LFLQLSLFPLPSNAHFERIHNRRKQSPLNFFKHISNGLSVVELPREKNTKSKGAGQNWKRIEDIEIHLGNDEHPIQKLAELGDSKDGTNKLPSQVDVQSQHDAIHNGDSFVGLGNFFFVLSVSPTEMENDKTEGREGQEFAEHSAKAQTSTYFPSMGIRSKELPSTYMLTAVNEMRTPAP